MKTSEVLHMVDLILPDQRVINDCLELLAQDEHSVNTRIEFDNGDMFIPKNPDIAIVTKTVVKRYLSIGFGSGYRVQMAIGGVEQVQFGIVYAKYCFATFYYDAEVNLITQDFHKDMR